MGEITLRSVENDWYELENMTVEMSLKIHTLSTHKIPLLVGITWRETSPRNYMEEKNSPPTHRIF